MLHTITLDEAELLLKARFGLLRTPTELVPLMEAGGRILGEDIIAGITVPEFNRSTVDGYAVMAADIFGCSESIPAILKLAGEVVMGTPSTINLQKGECAYVPTGGEVPAGADLVVMLEDAEDFLDGTIGITKPGAPAMNMILKGDDVQPGAHIYPRGKRLGIKDIGTLAALGLKDVAVLSLPRVSILSTGDELVDAGVDLPPGKIRDSNSPMLYHAAKAFGAAPSFMGIFPDDPQCIAEALSSAVEKSELVIITGGTSVGTKDAIPNSLASLGEVLFHGLAVKPGKPTLVGAVKGKPVFGLPGNPVAAFFMSLLLVQPLIYSMLDINIAATTEEMPINRSIPSNHGREDLIPVMVKHGFAEPIITKSNLIITLKNAVGYIRIPRDREGLSRGEAVRVIYFQEEKCHSDI